MPCGILDYMTVALFFGGSSFEHEVSLHSASFILRALAEGGHTAHVIAVDKTNAWHACDTKASIALAQAGKPLAMPARETEEMRVWAMPAGGLWHNARSPQPLHADCAFIMMHGTYGEDGTIQSVLASAGMPFTGSDAQASMLCMNKHLAKYALSQQGERIPVTPSCVISRAEAQELSLGLDGAPNSFGDAAPSVLREFLAEVSFPLILKPCASGSSAGVHAVRDEQELARAAKDSSRYGAVLIEKFLEGMREIEVPVTGPSREPAVYPPGEIIVDGVYTYEKKYIDTASVSCDVTADLPANVREKVMAYAAAAYTALGCSGFARADFFLLRGGEIFFNEINTIPGCTQTSLFPKALMAAGKTPAAIAEDILRCALEAHAERQAAPQNA